MVLYKKTFSCFSEVWADDEHGPEMHWLWNWTPRSPLNRSVNLADWAIKSVRSVDSTLDYNFSLIAFCSLINDKIVAVLLHTQKNSC